jgi:hypothetical protein
VVVQVCQVDGTTTDATLRPLPSIQSSLPPLPRREQRTTIELSGERYHLQRGVCTGTRRAQIPGDEDGQTVEVEEVVPSGERVADRWEIPVCVDCLGHLERLQADRVDGAAFKGLPDTFLAFLDLGLDARRADGTPLPKLTYLEWLIVSPARAHRHILLLSPGKGATQYIDTRTDLQRAMTGHVIARRNPKPTALADLSVPLPMSELPEYLQVRARQLGWSRQSCIFPVVEAKAACFLWPPDLRMSRAESSNRPLSRRWRSSIL